jgi:CubicO group peptidase (beta-lactamase class C family)
LAGAAKILTVILQDVLDKQVNLRGVQAVAAGSSVAGTRSVATRGAVQVTSDSCFRIASLTKTFTSSALVLTLREHNVPLSTPAIELLPDLAPDWRADTSLTVEQILGQVSGLRESVDSSTVATLGDGHHALNEAARLVVRAGNEQKPGGHWSYYNGNYFLAGAILAAINGASYETALKKKLLEPWHLLQTSFDAPRDSVTGWDGPTELPRSDYPHSRRPSGGLWSCLSDLLALGEGLLSDRALLQEIRRPRTTPDDPMTYGLGWALGPSGQMYLNGRLPGYRTAMLLVPDKDYVSVVLTNQQRALPAVARVLSDMQQNLTGDDIATAIDRFAA